MPEYSEEYQRILDRRERFKRDLAAAVKEPANPAEHPQPWTMGFSVHDEPGIQFFDANGRPVLFEFIRDHEDARALLAAVNGR